MCYANLSLNLNFGFGPGGCVMPPHHHHNHHHHGPHGPHHHHHGPHGPHHHHHGPHGPHHHHHGPHGPHHHHNGNLSDAVVGHKPGFFGCRDMKGYGLDLNNNGRYDAGRDGVLGFDFNRNGKIDRQEIERSREALKAFGGNYDLNGDGRTSLCEKIRGNSLQKRMQGVDTNHDGRLSASEIASGGGRVLIDQNRDGNFSCNESFSPFNIPTPGFGRGRLDFVDPQYNHNQVSHGWSWGHPPYFGC